MSASLNVFVGIHGRISDGQHSGLAQKAVWIVQKKFGYQKCNVLEGSKQSQNAGPLIYRINNYQV